MKNYIKFFSIFLLLCVFLFTSCSVDRLALLIRQYNSGALIAQKDEELEERFASVKEQFSSSNSKKLLVLYIEGLVYEKRKNYAVALNKFRESVEQNKSFLDAWVHIAKINLLLNDKRNAYISYLKCIDLINNEISYIDKNKWPKEHILLDDHVKYAIRYTMIDNSYLPSKQFKNDRNKIDYNDLKENLLSLKQTIIKICQSLEE